MDPKTARNPFCNSPRGTPMFDVRAGVETASAFEQIDLLLGSIESALHTISLAEEPSLDALYGLAFTVSTARALSNSIADGIYAARRGTANE